MTRLALLCLAAAVLLPAADIAGSWRLNIVSFGEEADAKLELKVDGSKLTGNRNELKIEGTATGDSQVHCYEAQWRKIR